MILYRPIVIVRIATVKKNGIKLYDFFWRISKVFQNILGWIEDYTKGIKIKNVSGF